MQFNYVANRLDPQYFETAVEMLKTKFGFVELRRTERAIWLRQPVANVDLNSAAAVQPIVTQINCGRRSLF